MTPVSFRTFHLPKPPSRFVRWLVNKAKASPYAAGTHNAVGHIYGDDGSLYMERYVLVPFGRKYWPGFRYLNDIAMRIHIVHRSDMDRHRHDHPWWSLCWLIDGDGYFEEVVGGHVMFQKVGNLIFRGPQHQHKLTLFEGGSSTSLFITGPWCNKWGFYTPEGKVYWREYLAIRKQNEPV